MRRANRGRTRARVLMLGKDFTPESENALLRATELARAHGASVHVVHVARRLPSALTRVWVVRRTVKRPYKAVVITANEGSDLQEQVAAAVLFSSERPSLLPL